MKTNQVLSAAEVFFKLLMGLIPILLTIIIFIFIHSSFSPTSYDKIIVNNGDTIAYNSKATSSTDYSNENNSKNTKPIYFNSITTFSKLFLLFNALFLSTLIILILKELSNFIKSVKDYNSFHNNNSNYFTLIAKYFSYLLIFQIIKTFIPLSIVLSDNHIQSFSFFNLNPFINYTAGILLSYTIAHVFKEGERLKIENELTI